MTLNNTLPYFQNNLMPLNYLSTMHSSRTFIPDLSLTNRYSKHYWILSVRQVIRTHMFHLIINWFSNKPRSSTPLLVSYYFL